MRVLWIEILGVREVKLYAETSQWPACLLFRWQPFSSGSFWASHSECQANRGDNVLLSVSSRSTGGVSIPVPSAVLLLVAEACRNDVSWRARAAFSRWPQGVRGWGTYKLMATRASRFILETFWAYHSCWVPCINLLLILGGACGLSLRWLVSAPVPFSDTWLWSWMTVLHICHKDPGHHWCHEKNLYPSGRQIQSIWSQQSSLGQAASKIFFPCWAAH